MKRWNSTGEWKAVGTDIVDSILKSSVIAPLDRSCWPSWASTQTESIYVFAPDEEDRLQVPGSSAQIVAGLLVERYDSKDPKHYNHNFYLIAGSTGRQYYMSPPIRPDRVAHHSSGAIILPESFGQPPFQPGRSRIIWIPRSIVAGRPNAFVRSLHLAGVPPPG